MINWFARPGDRGSSGHTLFPALGTQYTARITRKGHPGGRCARPSSGRRAERFYRSARRKGGTRGVTGGQPLRSPVPRPRLARRGSALRRRSYAPPGRVTQGHQKGFYAEHDLLSARIMLSGPCPVRLGPFTHFGCLTTIAPKIGLAQAFGTALGEGWIPRRKEPIG